MAATAPNEASDEFFGDQEDTAKQTGTDSCVSIDQADGLAGREARAVESRFRNLGFHEAYDKAKDSMLQQGFEEGYKQSFDLATRIGELLGEATSPVSSDSTDNKPASFKCVATKVHTFLAKMELEENPTTTPTMLMALANELQDLTKKAP